MLQSIIDSWQNMYQRCRIRIRANRYLRRGEPDECRFTCDCVVSGQSVLDVGAHRAAFTYWLARAVGASGQVYAFEPQPKLAKYIQRFAASSRDDNVTVCDVAVGDRDEQGKLFVSDEFTAWACLSDDASGAGETIDVPVVRLDTYLDQINAVRPISFAKVDVELHELAVFRGAERMLIEDKPVLLFESTPLYRLPPSENETFALLRDFGYVGYFFHCSVLTPVTSFTDRAIPVRKDATIQNFVFLHPDTAELTCDRPPYAVLHHGGRSPKARAA